MNDMPVTTDEPSAPNQFAPDIWEAVDAAREWLDRANGVDRCELTLRILKVAEEAGEASAAWIGALGSNPRKGVTHTREDVVAELADVAMSALVAVASLGYDPRQALERRSRAVTRRMT
ncbi:MAG: hypothetical protein ACRDXX_19645 [Stackebrandtia sp.]